MSSWSMNDGSALTGTMTFTNGSTAVAGSSCAYTTELKVGDVIISAGGEKSRVASITDDDNLVLTANFAGSTEAGVAATVTRPPANFASAAPHIDDNILGVNIAEMTGGSDNIVNLTIENAGSGYAASPAPSVTVSGGGGSSGAATVTITANKVSAITLTNAGTGYTSVPSVTTTAPAEVTFNAASAVDGTDITLTSHPFATGDTVTYSDKGGTAIAELTDGGTFKVIKVDANTIRLHNGSGDAITLTDGPSENHGLTGETATFGVSLGSTGIPHAGWVKKTVGTGGRAGRVSYEVLVAASTIGGDASDDVALPDS